MRVMCIKKATIDAATGKRINGLCVEGNEYRVVGHADADYYYLAEFPFTKYGSVFYKGNFIPLSEIDEIEFVRNYNTEKAC